MTWVISVLPIYETMNCCVESFWRMWEQMRRLGMKFFFVFILLLFATKHTFSEPTISTFAFENNGNPSIVYGSQGREKAGEIAFQLFFDEYQAGHYEKAFLWLHCACVIGCPPACTWAQIMFLGDFHSPYETSHKYRICSRQSNKQRNTDPERKVYDSHHHQKKLWIIERRFPISCDIILRNAMEKQEEKEFCPLPDVQDVEHMSFSDMDAKAIEILKSQAHRGDAHAAFDVSAYYNSAGNLEMGRIWALYSAWLGGCYKAYLDMIRICDVQGFDTQTRSWVNDEWKSACLFWFNCMLANVSCNLSSDRFTFQQNWPSLASRLYLLKTIQNWLNL